MQQVGLIGSPERAEIERLCVRLEERGAEGVVFDSRRDPAIRLRPDGEELMGRDLRTFSAFYVADLGLLPAGVRASDGSTDREQSVRALRASQRHLASWTALFHRLARRAKVANPPRAWDLHGEKPFESATLVRLGILAPATCATTDPQALVALAARPNALATAPDAPAAAPNELGGWIRKGLVGGYGYTREFAPPADVAAARAELAGSAALVQERIVGVNVRAYVIGGRYLGAAEVHASEGAEIDSRKQTSRLRRVEAPASARTDAETLARHWGMEFAAVDFMRDERSGAWSVLECNSSPFFVEFERFTGIDVSSALADHLTSRARGTRRA
ncbi:MAG: hypothetical protein L6Q99_08940 [Planctomycetes bacterium]|nr:hypothetical protein [Planctomycetota bacterium]